MKRTLPVIFIIIFAAISYANPFSTYKEHLGLSDAKQDSFYVINPVVRKSMYFNSVLEINVENRFSLPLLAYDPNGVVIMDNNLASATQTILNDDLYIRVTSSDQIGRTDITYTVYADTLFEVQTSDTFTLTVDDPAYSWIEMGSAYSFLPQYCVGIDTIKWKAATHFSFGTDSMYLKQIEFGFQEEEMVDWKLVEFNEVPTDILIGDMADSLLCSANEPSYVEFDYIQSNFTDTYFSGDVALVFSSDGNFMSMDPNAESSGTWIYAELEDYDYWELANSYTPDYNGAWYMRMQVYNLTTGIEETYYSGNISNFELHQNYPNPFNPTTEINFTLKHNSVTKLTVFNSNGEVVKVLNVGRLEKGSHSFSFDGQDLNSGLYFYQLEVNGVRSTKKMILMK
ncbi:MAG: T9SS type A sorting domain-containing protein [Candidatus Delongbacteria bacterium]|nr:T9SS type A sorting domain-containing protein [Candidatus Delongbacteria bacterium]